MEWGINKNFKINQKVSWKAKFSTQFFFWDEIGGGYKHMVPRTLLFLKLNRFTAPLSSNSQKASRIHIFDPSKQSTHPILYKTHPKFWSYFLSFRYVFITSLILSTDALLKLHLQWLLQRVCQIALEIQFW